MKTKICKIPKTKHDPNKSLEECETAIFAGGCFWCTESDFENREGIVEVISGYTGGDVEDPSYEEVCSGETGHVEAVIVYFNPKKISYKELLDIYWRSIDPTDAEGQFADKGSQYITAIFYKDNTQKKLAEDSKKSLERSHKFDKPIATKILNAQDFYPAEEYHQKYHEKNPIRYKLYRAGSGRTKFIEENWKERTK